MIKSLITTIRILFLAVFIWLMLIRGMKVWLSIFAISLFLGLLFGRIFCGWICPMNTLMILTEWLSKKLRLQSKDAPKWLGSRLTPVIMLIVLFLTTSVLKRSFGFEIPILLYILFLSVIVAFRYRPEVFHNKICPFGVLQSLIGRFALLSENVNYDKCIGCKACETVCPSKAVIVSNQDKIANINPKVCHQCFGCQQVCPKNAISYGKLTIKKATIQRSL